MMAVGDGVWLSAFMAGLLGSGHCFAMCGGIAGSLGALAAGNRASGPLPAALQFNLGRLAGYALLGAASGALLGWVGGAGGVPEWGGWLRLATALLILAMGLHYAVGWTGLNSLQRLGARAWSRIVPLARRAGARGDSVGRILLGACWGLLPCGLVYTVLLMAAARGDAVGGLTVMLAFGLGTLPSMLGLTAAAPGLSMLLSDRSFRRFIGLSLIVLSFWMLLTTWPALTGSHPGSAHSH